MENASKALLISASILIVILLIAMGVKVFNSTSGTTDQVEGTMQTTEISTFNNKFTPYIGENKNKTNATSILNLIIANNSTSARKVYVTTVKNGTKNGAAIANTDLSNLMNTLEDKKYTIEAVYENSGYIELIKIY